MDDQFLYQLREQPDSEFAKSLHRKLTRYHPNSDWRSITSFNSFFRSKSAKPVWITVLIVVSFFAAMTVSPVRAFVSSLIIIISGQSFEVTDDYPGDNYPGTVTIIEPQVMSLSEALAIFPHAIKLPTNIPTEFVLNEENIWVYVGEEGGCFADSILIQWISDTNVVINLMITN
ncbi:MAG: hypothetical protein ABIJ39_10785 [Chloroflexota bacterium]